MLPATVPKTNKLAVDAELFNTTLADQIYIKPTKKPTVNVKHINGKTISIDGTSNLPNWTNTATSGQVERPARIAITDCGLTALRCLLFITPSQDEKRIIKM